MNSNSIGLQTAETFMLKYLLTNKIAQRPDFYIFKHQNPSRLKFDFIFMVVMLDFSQIWYNTPFCSSFRVCALAKRTHYKKAVGKWTAWVRLYTTINVLLEINPNDNKWNQNQLILNFFLRRCEISPCNNSVSVEFSMVFTLNSQPSLSTDQTEEMPSVSWTSLSSSFTWLRLTFSLFTPNIAWYWFSTLHLLLDNSDSYCPTTSTFRTSFLTYSFRSLAARAITISNTRHKQIDLLVCCYIVWSRITCFNCWELRRSKEHYRSRCVNTLTKHIHVKDCPCIVYIHKYLIIVIVIGSPLHASLQIDVSFKVSNCYPVVRKIG